MKSWHVCRITAAEYIVEVVSGVTKIHVAEISPCLYQKRRLGCLKILGDSDSRRSGSCLDIPGRS